MSHAACDYRIAELEAELRRLQRIVIDAELAGLDVAHLLVEHDALVAQLRAQRRQPDADQRIRAAALTAAASWLAAESLVDPTAPEERRYFDVYGTGHPMPADPGRYLGTAHLDNGALVLHVFDREDRP